MDDAGPLTNILVWLFASFSICMVTLRLYSRLRLTKAAGWDDLVIIISLAIVLVASSLSSYAISKGQGKHLAALSTSAIVEASKWSIATDGALIFSFVVPKLAVALLLDRLFGISKKGIKARFILYTPAVILLLWSTAAIILWFLQCRPVQGIWDKSIKADCLDPLIFQGEGIGEGSTSAAADFYYALYPIYFIYRLQMPSKRKVYLSVMLGLGVIAGAVAIWKTTQFPAVSVPNADVTYASAVLVYATLIEANVIIVLACVPTIGPSIRLVAAKVDSAKGSMSKLVKSTRHRGKSPRNISSLENDLEAQSWSGHTATGGSSASGQPVSLEKLDPAKRDYGNANAKGAAGQTLVVSRSVNVSVVEEAKSKTEHN